MLNRFAPLSNYAFDQLDSNVFANNTSCRVVEDDIADETFVRQYGDKFDQEWDSSYNLPSLDLQKFI